MQIPLRTPTVLAIYQVGQVRGLELVTRETATCAQFERTRGSLLSVTHVVRVLTDVDVCAFFQYTGYQRRGHTRIRKQSRVARRAPMGMSAKDFWLRLLREQAGKGVDHVEIVQDAINFKYALPTYQLLSS